MLSRVAPLFLVLLAACEPSASAPVYEPGPVRTVETLAEGQNRPNGVAVRGQRVMWANTGRSQDEANGEIVECRTLDCSDGSVVLHDEMAGPRNPMFAGNRIVWQTFATMDGSGNFGNANLYSAPGDGSSIPWPMLWVGAGLQVSAAVSDGERVYFGTDAPSDSLLAWCPADGCPDSSTSLFLISDRMSGASAIARSDDALYVAELYTGDIVAVAESNGARETLASLQIGVLGLAHDDTHLYWGTSVEELGEGIEVQNYVARVPLDGGPVEELFDTDVITALHGTPDWLFFGEANGDISRLSLVTLEVELLASGFSRPSGFAFHQGTLYWTDSARNGGVYRMAL